MILKEELLKLLNEAKQGEESSIPIYTKHLESTMFWLGWGKETIEKNQKLFFYLARESNRHKGIVESLIKKISEDKRDAF